MLSAQKSCLRLLVFLALLGAANAGFAQGTSVGGERPLPVAYRGEPLGDVLMQLAQRIDATYIIDPQADAEKLRSRVRMVADHLTAAEVVRWLARDVGLEAVVVEGTMLVAPPERLPVVWRERHRRAVLLVQPSVAGGAFGAGGRLPSGGSGSGSPSATQPGGEPTESAPVPDDSGEPVEAEGGAPDDHVPPLRRPAVRVPAISDEVRAFPDGRLADALSREGAFDWIDTPLSLVSQAISARFGLDLLVAPELIAEAPLVTSPEGTLPLIGVLQTLADQTGAAVWYCDGALRVGGKAPVPGHAPAHGAPSGSSGSPVPVIRPLDAWFELNGGEAATWAALAAQVEAATGLPCRIEGDGPGAPPVMTASGSLRTVLDAGRAAGWWRWELRESPARVLLITPLQR